MLRTETTFVIGAGANRDFGFPLGDGLRNLIGRLAPAVGQILFEGMRTTPETRFSSEPRLWCSLRRMHRGMPHQRARAALRGRSRQGAQSAFSVRDRSFLRTGGCGRAGQAGPWLVWRKGGLAALGRGAGKIRTFTEAMEEDVSDQVKDGIAGADTIVFMGFGWLPQNMALLRTDNRVTNATKVFATTMGMRNGEVDGVSYQLDEMRRRGRHVGQPLPGATFTSENGDCKALMVNCWLRLTSDWAVAAPEVVRNLALRGCCGCPLARLASTSGK